MEENRRETDNVNADMHESGSTQPRMNLMLIILLEVIDIRILFGEFFGIPSLKLPLCE